MSTVIRVENLSKQYRLGLVGASTFKEDAQRWWANMRGKEDPFLKLGVDNDRTISDSANFVWSLRDINFEVNQGEVLGIIGRNGAGKSTLLKILSKITAPTIGSIKAKGRIASLLEVGTGFHPELTGKENIYLNGAILGMSKHEITRKLDEIIAFAGVEKYIYTPVKRYSSGMYVRLAFAVAAHLESEILIIDEVLAVGDTEFQKKCLGKMREVSKSEGRTILFVSHNMSALRNLCTKSILLKNGMLSYHGNIVETINKYNDLFGVKFLGERYVKENVLNQGVELISASLKDNSGNVKTTFELDEEIILDVTYLCSQNIKGSYGYIDIKNNDDLLLLQSDTNDFLPNVFDGLKIGLNFFKIRIPKNIFSVGEYSISMSIASPFSDQFTFEENLDFIKFIVIDTKTSRGDNRKSITSVLLNWEKQN